MPLEQIRKIKFLTRISYCIYTDRNFKIIELLGGELLGGLFSEQHWLMLSEHRFEFDKRYQTEMNM